MISEDELKTLLDENESLRNQVQQLRSGPLPDQSSYIDSNPLCKRCYGWRLGVAAAAGLAAATGVWIELDGHRALLQGIQSALGLGRGGEAAGTVKAGISIAVEAIPPLAVVCDWKWRQYKAGYAGLVRAIVDACRAFKEGRGK